MPLANQKFWEIKKQKAGRQALWTNKIRETTAEHSQEKTFVKGKE